MIEYDRYAWLKFDPFNFGQNRKSAVVLCAGFWGIGKGVSDFTADFG